MTEEAFVLEENLNEIKGLEQEIRDNIDLILGKLRFNEVAQGKNKFIKIISWVLTLTIFPKWGLKKLWKTGYDRLYTKTTYKMIFSIFERSKHKRAILYKYSRESIKIETKMGLGKYLYRGGKWFNKDFEEMEDIYLIEVLTLLTVLIKHAEEILSNSLDDVEKLLLGQTSKLGKKEV